MIKYLTTMVRNSIIFDVTLLYSILSCVFFRLCFAPYSITWLAWSLPVIWTLFILHIPHAQPINLEGCSTLAKCKYRLLSNKYIKLWFCSSVMWYSALSCLDFFAFSFWLEICRIVSSITIPIFLLVYILIVRLALINFKLPLVFIAPIVWCGVEWVRKNYYFGGFSGGSLEHTQYDHLWLIQIADIIGEYGVGMYIILVGTCIGHCFGNKQKFTSRIQQALNSRTLAIFTLISVTCFVCFYSRIHLAPINSNKKHDDVPELSIGLMQGTIDETIIPNELEFSDRLIDYFNLSRLVSPKVDIVIWPEAWCYPALYIIAPGYVPNNWRNEPINVIESMINNVLQENHHQFTKIAVENKTPQIIGVTTQILDSAFKYKHYRPAAVFIDSHGKIQDIYSKNHLVPFIEYNPFWSIFTSHNSSAYFQPSTEVKAFTIPIKQHTAETSKQNDIEFYLAPNICYDSMFPHFIRNQVITLSKQGYDPDALVSITNDGSFKFDIVTEMHFASYIFRAIENRKPYLIAANSGYSAWIDANGKVIQKGKKGTETYIIAKIHKNSSYSLYRKYGDFFPFCCMVVSCVIVCAFIVKDGTDEVLSAADDSAVGFDKDVL